MVNPLVRWMGRLYLSSIYQNKGGVKMGGRGIDSGSNIDQLTIWQHKERIEVE